MWMWPCRAGPFLRFCFHFYPAFFAAMHTRARLVEGKLRQIAHSKARPTRLAARGCRTPPLPTTRDSHRDMAGVPIRHGHNFAAKGW